MCGRYVIAGHDELSERFQLRYIPANLFPSYNAAPSQELPVIVENDDGERVLRPMTWGLVPRWRKAGGGRAIAPINARAETVLEKPMFRGLVGRKRCLVPARGFYEWRRTGGRKQPFYIRRQDGELFAFAGLYDDTSGDDADGLPSFTIITTEPNALVATLHNRMPVMLQPDDEDDWVSREETDPQAVVPLLQPYPAAAMVADPVSLAVNNTRNNRPELVEPVDEDEA